MRLTKENYEDLLPSLQMASSKLKGSERRQFLGQLALDIGYGGRSLVLRSRHASGWRVAFACLWHKPQVQY